MKIKATATIDVPKDKCCATCKYYAYFDYIGDSCYFFNKFIYNYKPCRPCLKARKEAESERV